MDLVEWGGVGVLREAEEGKNVVRMYCMREESIPNNNKSKQINKNLLTIKIKSNILSSL